MSNSDNRPTTAAAPPLSKEAPVHLNEVCNDCNEKQDCLLVFSQQQHFPSHVGRRKKKKKKQRDVASGVLKLFLMIFELFRCFY